MIHGDAPPGSPSSFIPLREDLAALVRLALPVALVQVGMLLMGAVDTIMVGRVSPTDLAAVALGNLYYFGVTVFEVVTGQRPWHGHHVDCRADDADINRSPKSDSHF